ncbi:MAG TPA: hypothetical protein VK601_31200 [Kofleriaceae bacterium]|nr:hypothetical protein [Kofleriaceae bacterium]
MPILFVNGKRRGLRIRGRAKVTTSRRRARRNPFPPGGKGNNFVTWEASTKHTSTSRPKYRKAKLGLDYKKYGGVTKYGHMVRLAKRNPAKRKRVKPRRRMSSAQAAAFDRTIAKIHANYKPGKRRKKSVKRGRRARRSTSMARKKRQPEGLRRYQAARRKAGKWGRPGKTRKRRAGDKRHGTRSRARRVKRRSGAPKKRRRARKATTVAPKRRRARRTKRRTTTKRRRRARRSSTPKRRRSRRTRRVSAHSARTVRMGPPSRMYTAGGTLKMNPSRRRRRKSSRRHRRSSRRRHRRSARRGYSRRYRRNPGGFLVDLAKRAIPVLAAFYGTRLLVSKIGPMIPGVSALGTLTNPVLALATVVGINFGAKKVAAIAKHKEALLLGSGIALAESLIQAFAPASIKAMIGMSDYIQMGDYIAVGATPINDSMTLSDYIAVGSDGVEEELGLEEELGVEEELGNDLLGGVRGGGLMATVPTQSFLQPVPARSFTKMIPAAGAAYDHPGQLYGGIFNGGWSAR